MDNRTFVIEHRRDETDPCTICANNMYRESAEKEFGFLRKDNERLREALKEVSLGKGAFALDPFTHCRNTVEDMKNIAKQALESKEG